MSPFSIPPRDAFAAKLKPDGSAMIWATFLGGAGDDAAQSIAFDSSGNVWIDGTTSSATFPNANGWMQNGGDFLVELSSSGSALSYSARFPAGAAAQSVAVDVNGAVHLAGSSGLVSVLTPGQPFPFALFGITNAAGGPVAGRVSPGELIALYGPHIGPPAPVNATVDSAGFIPKTLGGVQVVIDNLLAPLLYVSDTQINAIVPFELPAGDSTAIQIVKNGSATPTFRASADVTSPGIFLNPDGSAAAINQDGTLNSQLNPAKSDSIVSIWVTGTGAVYAAQDGQVLTTAQDYYCCQVQANYQAADVLYAGASPGLVAGITQINFRVPEQSSTGQVTLTITAGGRTSPSATIFVAQ